VAEKRFTGLKKVLDGSNGVAYIPTPLLTNLSRPAQDENLMFRGWEAEAKHFLLTY
jgi:hypothetical protein